MLIEATIAEVTLDESALGIAIFAASRRDQLAAALPKLGHGAFTYVVPEGLDGGGDAIPPMAASQ